MWGTLGEPGRTGARLNFRQGAGFTTLRHATYDAGANVPFHVHDRPSIVYGVGGPCIETGASGRRIVRRRLTFLPAGFAHTLDYAGPTQVFAIEAQGDLEPRLGLSAIAEPVALPATLYKQVWSILVLLNGAEDTQLLSERIDAFWQQSSRHLHAPTPAWLRPLVDQLHANWESPPRTTVLAAELGFSPQFLCRVFKRVMGVTLKQYNQAIRLDYARGLLWGSGMTISEVASITGFSDQAHLTRTLRQHSGATPRQLRASSFVPPAPLRHSYRAA